MLDRERLDDLGKAEVFEVMRASRARVARERADELVAAAHLAVLYDAPSMAPVPDLLAVVSERMVTLGGAGTPQVSEFAATELGHGLACGPDAAAALLADALDLKHRLPGLWERLLEGEVDAWRARVVAQETRALSLEAVEWVDARLGETRRSITGVVGQLVAEALRRFDPESFAQREAARLDGRGVFVERPGPAGVGATTRVAMVLDTPDAALLDATLDDLATIHAVLGDHSPLQVRRAKAVGTLTNPQLAMDLLAGDLTTHATTKSAGSKLPKGVRGRSAVVYLHLDACDVTDFVNEGVDVGGRIERLGPATLDLLGEWLTRPGGIARDGITLRPVLETTRTDGGNGRVP
ncbi:MAG: DUF222 domain-containing protein, partial [Nocardioides sp.]|nr:DUF222 domain-containing protein [Nocardioides sp.]